MKDFNGCTEDTKQLRQDALRLLDHTRFTSNDIHKLLKPIKRENVLKFLSGSLDSLTVKQKTKLHDFMEELKAEEKQAWWDNFNRKRKKVL